ncbi:hypothetical protein F503_05596 [Ophiostoma piceae UAMH 11346]|uniref:Uncharacterized protein n=1 Tax=Ophiostoma piceae (strain UAMH 11346) TaxID=1262450 RepID=S3CEH8_OPHP1|nr:hypothetical protein F503_05596 [Ophiostoma piceae UAMH 11346]
MAYAQVTAEDTAVIFQFKLDVSSLQSLTNRIDDDNGESVKDRADMRRAIWPTITTAWPSCATSEATWDASRDSLFDKYLDLLRGIEDDALVPRATNLGGKGCSKLVGVAGKGGLVQHAFKSVDFQTYLQVHYDDDEFARRTVDAWSRSSTLAAGMAEHSYPHMQKPPKMLVSECCHRASEHAEGFAVGRMMWMLLAQTVDGFGDVEHPDDVDVVEMTFWGVENSLHGAGV